MSPIILDLGSQDHAALMASLLPFATARPWIIRWTGGCGNMEPTDARGLDVIVEAFVRAASMPFGWISRAIHLFGGTRMVQLSDPSIVIPGITEVPCAIKERISGGYALGVVVQPQEYISLDVEGRLIFARDSTKDQVTIPHPGLSNLFIARRPEDERDYWRQEYRICKYLTGLVLRHNIAPAALLVAYNGGQITREELNLWIDSAANDPRYHILLVKGGGRQTDALAAEMESREELPTGVHIAQVEVDSLLSVLSMLGVNQCITPHCPMM